MGHDPQFENNFPNCVHHQITQELLHRGVNHLGQMVKGLVLV